MAKKFSPQIQKLVDRAKRAASSGVPRREKGRTFHREAVDGAEADGLFEWATGSSEWSARGPVLDPNTKRPNWGRAIAEQLWRKMVRGVYDPARAWKAWLPMVVVAAKDLAKSEPGRYGPATREHVAREIAKEFEADVHRKDWASHTKARGNVP